jgi:hypothetical protein
VREVLFGNEAPRSELENVAARFKQPDDVDDAGCK